MSKAKAKAPAPASQKRSVADNTAHSQEAK